MDIERISQRYMTEVGEAAVARRAERAPSEVARRADAERPRGDTLEISDRARELARARQAVDEAPEVRAEKVADIKKRLEDGTYTVSPKLLAHKLLDHADELL
jgi:flagellar biosynthesis anti-sigma factor FlgM